MPFTVLRVVYVELIIINIKMRSNGKFTRVVK